MKDRIEFMKKELEHWNRMVERSIEIMRDFLKILPRNKDTRTIIKNAKKALDNIEISARCSYLTKHTETLKYIDWELSSMITHIEKYVVHMLGWGPKEIEEAKKKAKEQVLRKEKN